MALNGVRSRIVVSSLPLPYPLRLRPKTGLTASISVRVLTVYDAIVVSGASAVAFLSTPPPVANILTATDRVVLWLFTRP